MSLGSYSKFASVLSLIGLLSFASEQAQQTGSNEAETTFIGKSDAQQLVSGRQPGALGSLPAKEAATPDDKAIRNESATASESTTGRAAPQPQPIAPLPFASERKLTPLDKAYLDAFSILRENSACSRFYGGPSVIEALNQLTLLLKPSYLDRTIAMRMRGKVTIATNYTSGFSFRLFEKAELNVNGPFYSSSTLPNRPRVLGIGKFSPNTREARVTILLHELGHLVKRGDKQWVLPDDGGDPSLSQQNTERVLAVCGEQIKGLAETTFAQELLSAQTPVKPARVSGESALFKAQLLAQ